VQGQKYGLFLTDCNYCIIWWCKEAIH